MKWLLVFTIIFIFGWIIYKDKMPENIKASDAADVLTSVFFPIEKYFDKYFPNILNYGKSIKVEEIKDYQAVGVLKNLKGTYHEPAYMFIYDKTSIIEKDILLGVNKILSENPERANNFFIIAVGNNNKAEFEYFFNTFRKINFVPYYIESSGSNELLNFFALDAGEKIEYMPISYFKKANSQKVTEISTGFYTRSRVQELLNEKGDL